MIKNSNNLAKTQAFIFTVSEEKVQSNLIVQTVKKITNKIKKLQLTFIYYEEKHGENSFSR